jgi:hypothetical protein
MAEMAHVVEGMGVTGVKGWSSLDLASEWRCVVESVLLPGLIFVFSFG